MRFQLLVGLGTTLFVFAAWSAVGRYEQKREAFGDLVELEQDRLDRAKQSRAWNDFVVQVALPPSPSELVFDGGSDYLPNVFGFNAAVPQRIHYSSTLDYNFAIPKFNRLDWTFIASYLFTFGALVLCFDAVSGESEGGTMRLLGSYSVPRHQVLLGKHLAALTALLTALATGAVASLALFSLLQPGEFGWRDFQLIAVWLIGVALVLSFHSGMALLLSVVCRRSSQSLNAAISLWIVMVVGIPSAAQLLSKVFHPSRTASEVGQEITLKTAEEILSGGRRQFPSANERAARRREVAELYNQQLLSSLSQFELAGRLSQLSPEALLVDSLNHSFQTGVFGLRAFIAETAVEASSFSEELKRGPETVVHPIVPLAERWLHSPPPPPPWADWTILGILNVLTLTGACLVFERKDLV